MTVKVVVVLLAMTTMAKAQFMSLEDKIMELAADSNLAEYKWRGRGRAPIGYVKGMAVAWARVYEKWKLGDPPVMLMAMANTHDPDKDSLSWYAGIFDMREMRNDDASADTLRHLFVLLTGLGMRESSGKFCEGRDRSASNTSSDTAEAGLFQMSWDAHPASREIYNVFERSIGEYDDLMHVFHEGVRCSEADLQNYGHGEGREFQDVCKGSPMCAILTAGVALRVIRKHFGPINTRAAEVRPEANELFKAIQNMVDNQVVAQNEPF